MWWDRTNFVEMYRLWTVMMTPPYLRSTLNNDWISPSPDTKTNKESNDDVHTSQDEKRTLAKLINNQIILLEQMDKLKGELETHTKAMQRLGRRSKDL